MAKQTVESLVEGGKASAAPPLGPALGPLGVNIGQVVAEINKKTASFNGMQVPVKVTVDSETKSFTITVGTPPASALIKKEADLKKGSSNPLTDKVADFKIEQIIKIAKMKEDSLLGNNLKSKVKEIMGTCQSMGILVEGLPAHDAIEKVNEGAFDAEIKSGKTELSAAELKQLEEEKKRLAADYEQLAKDIIAKLEVKENNKIRAKLAEANIPRPIIDEIAPMEKKTAEAAGGAKKK